MLGDHATAALLDGVGLLERALGYTLGSLLLVTADAMTRRSPCRDWDLRALLAHMNDSLEALQEAADVGYIGLAAPQDYGDPSLDPVSTLRNRACRMLGAWADAQDREPVSVAGLPLTTGAVVTTGAVEVAVHGWDVAQACGRPRTIPSALAEELLPLADLLVTDADRPSRFAAPVAVPPAAGPETRLLAFLGRRPARV